MDKASLQDARQFILREGRLLERRLVAVIFDGASPSGVLDALAGYRNEDGGFGHALEPDKRAPESQPLDVEVAFQVMESIGRIDEGFVTEACDYLRSVGPGVGCLTQGALEYPKASHWAEWALTPALNPTAGIVALLWKWGVEHPWREEATAFCWEQLAGGLPVEGHSFGEVLAFLDAVPDRSRAEPFINELRGRIASLTLFRHDASSDGYGVTLLHYAPTPRSRWLSLFDGSTVEEHLEALVHGQQDDGGWPISWETVGPAAVEEWRGMETLRALRTLQAFGRLS